MAKFEKTVEGKMNEDKVYEVWLDGRKGIYSPINLWQKLIQSPLKKIAGEGTPKINTKSLEIYKTPNNDAVVFEIYWKEADVIIISKDLEETKEYLSKNIKGLELKTKTLIEKQLQKLKNNYKKENYGLNKY